MEKINLKEILAKHSKNVKTKIDAGYELSGKETLTVTEVLLIMQEIWNLAVEKCKEVVQVTGEDSEDYNLNKEFAEESIEQVKQMI